MPLSFVPPMKRRTPQPTIIDNNGQCSLAFLEWLARQPNALLFETTLRDASNQKSYLFLKPKYIITATSLKKVERALEDVDAALRDGYHVAGFLSYEAGAAFERVLQQEARLFQPLVWFGVYKNPVTFNHRTKRFEQGSRVEHSIARQLQAVAETKKVPLAPTPSVTYEEYEKAIEKIKEYIVAGDTYQVNYTFKLRFPWKDSAAALYARLRNAQRVEYSVFLSLRERKILSLSPELFFRNGGNAVTVKPMKGTAPRGRTREEDSAYEKELRASEKNRAENLMIVDMLRNDLGRIAKTGSVRVASFFDVERYDTILQATSTIEAKLRSGVTPSEIMKCLFPCGSVTGAPKIRTMQIIRELESEPRGVYTGSIGFFSPKKKAVWNVAIRTVVLNTRERRGEMGVGSGIVYDSNSEHEYRECLLKAKFLMESHGEFALLETMRWEPQYSYRLLKYHMGRLERSAEYFGFSFKRAEGLAFLKRHGMKLRKASKRTRSFRVRLTMTRDGVFSATQYRLERSAGDQHARISEHRTDSGDRFLYHKTTNRTLYDRELERAMLDGFFDVIFLNERHELTEGARSNLVVKKDGRGYTPPVECGLLP
ncbi:MAG TPA: aminodeoxychorismate synthase component I, partial [Bacteroidota bacterium]